MARSLDLPYDWSVEGPFDEKNPSGASGGYLPCGTGWYRKTFKLPADAGGRKVFIEFDGVYMNGEVWINGHRLGKRPYGCMGFEYDLTPHLNINGDNVLAVRVDNSLQPSSRWYTGSGIYRHVWLKFTDPLRVAHWGTQISTPKITAGQAGVAVKTTCRNGYDKAKQVDVTQTITDAGGKAVASTSSTFELAAGEEKVFDQALEITRPARWSPTSPNLYTVRTELRDGERLVDRYESPLGVREVVFDADRGLLLNGESVIMKGMCNYPSVIMWSIGNEVPEAQKYGELETLKKLQALSHKLDPTREVTVGTNFMAGANESGFAEIMDLVGYNGGGSCFQYEADHLRFPERRIYASEVPPYTNCDSVELFLNGKSLGSKKFTEKTDMHLEWAVPYAPGELKAVATKDGAVVATTSTSTAGLPATLALSADQSEVSSGRRDLSYVTIRMEDKDGKFVPKAAQWVTLDIDGPGRIVGIGNGDPLSHESFQGRTVRTFNGLALTITTPIKIIEPGKHVLIVWMTDPGVVIDKILLDFGFPATFMDIRPAETASAFQGDHRPRWSHRERQSPVCCLIAVLAKTAALV